MLPTGKSVIVLGPMLCLKRRSGLAATPLGSDTGGLGRPEPEPSKPVEVNDALVSDASPLPMEMLPVPIPT